MKILMVSSFLPYPLLNGGNIRLYNLLKHLSKIHEITLICEKRDYQKQNDIEEIEKLCRKVITVDRKKQWSIANILKTAFSLESFLIVGHTSLELKRAIAEELEKEKYDLIHVETSYVMQNLPKVNIPIVLVEHNVEYLVYGRYARQAPIFLRPFLLIDVWKLKLAERSFWKKATKLIAVSKIEKDIIGASEVIPNGADVEKFKVQSSKFKVTGEKMILFIGDFRWIQNRDAIEWIIKDIWPEVKFKVQTLPASPKLQRGEKFKVKLWVVSKRIPDKIKNLTNDSSVIFDENAPSETEKIYQRTDILLSPIRVGGGISFKILEAMASGVPVVTTGLGNEGIGGQDRVHLLTSENSKGLATNVTELLKDKNMYKEIALNARKFIEENYEWRGIAKKLDSVYKSLA